MDNIDYVNVYVVYIIHGYSSQFVCVCVNDLSKKSCMEKIQSWKVKKSVFHPSPFLLSHAYL